MLRKGTHGAGAVGLGHGSNRHVYEGLSKGMALGGNLENEEGKAGEQPGGDGTFPSLGDT